MDYRIYPGLGGDTYEVYTFTKDDDAATGTIIIMLLMAPIGGAVFSVLSVAGWIAKHFILVSALYFAVTVVFCLIIIKLKKLRSLKAVIDAAGNFALLSAAYCLLFLYLVPAITSDEGISYLFLSFFLFAIMCAAVFIQQCIRRIVKSTVINLLISLTISCAFYLVIRFALLGDEITIATICSTYKITPDGAISRLLNLLF